MKNEAMSTYPIPAQALVLISRSPVLIEQLQGLQPLHRVEDVEHLPPYTPLKAILVDFEYAALVDLSWLRRAYPTSFLAVYAPLAALDPHLRLACTNAGANMVAHTARSFLAILRRAVLPPDGKGSYICPYCSLGGLTGGQLREHLPAYHINWPASLRGVDSCPLCRRELRGLPLQVHMHEDHRPPSPPPPPSSSSLSSSLSPFAPLSSPLSSSLSLRPRPYTPSLLSLFPFSLLVVRLAPQIPRYLLVQEFGDLGFWLPGGGVERGEGFAAAARRECEEESGVKVVLKGVLQIDHHYLGRDGEEERERGERRGEEGGRRGERERERERDGERRGEGGEERGVKRCRESGEGERAGRGRGDVLPPDVHIVRMRVVFYAEPERAPSLPPLSSLPAPLSPAALLSLLEEDGGLAPKCAPDFESAGACWVDYADLQARKLKLRGEEPVKWSRYIEEGGAIHPLSLLTERF